MSKSDYDARSYWDQRLDRDFSLRGVGVTNFSRQYNAWLYRVRDRVFRRALATIDVDPSGARVVDVGPGVGFYVQRWKRLGADVTGVDIADSAVRRLRQSHPDVRIERLDVSDDVSSLGDGYDVVTAFDVLFHIVDDDRYRAALRNIFGLLRPGGWFVFTDTLARRRMQSAKHYVRRSLAEVEQALQEAGFEVVRRRPAFFLMTYPFDASDKKWRERWMRWIGSKVGTAVGGSVVGAALYLPELTLTRLYADGPASEVLVCRRPLLPAAASGGRAPARLSPPARTHRSQGRGRAWLAQRYRRVRRDGAMPTLRRTLLRLLPALRARVIDVQPGVSVLTRRRDITLRPLGDGAVLVHGDSHSSANAGHGLRVVGPAPLFGKERAKRDKALSDWLMWQHLRDVLRRYRVDCVIDVGANRGQYVHRLRKAGYKGVVHSFEPVAEVFAQLAAAAAQDPLWHVHQVALGRETGELEMNVVPGTLSSLLAPSTFGAARYERFNDQLSTQQVPVRRLEDYLPDIAGTEDVPARILLKLDTQGFDLEAFAGVGALTPNVVALQSEVALMTIYEHMPRLPEALAVYEEAGFEVSGLYPVSRDQRTGRVLEYDCVMVRADAL
ncbi:MAG: FkbM family methyltransferase [Actinomycetota bacterium]|nr:FkbM family methyltransferase [Actinomycetota bacterium]